LQVHCERNEIPAKPAELNDTDRILRRSVNHFHDFTTWNKRTNFSAVSRLDGVEVFPSLKRRPVHIVSYITTARSRIGPFVMKFHGATRGIERGKPMESPAKCRYWGAETWLYERGVPICIACMDDRERNKSQGEQQAPMQPPAHMRPFIS
jgi:hypothetical protein